jgi:hypothetical protein
MPHPDTATGWPELALDNYIQSVRLPFCQGKAYTDPDKLLDELVAAKRRQHASRIFKRPRNS